MGERLRLTLTDIGNLGGAMAHQDGRLVFVDYGIPGEEVEVEVGRQRRTYAEARILEVISPSPSRVSPPCAYYGQCSGCQWQHVDYARQLEFKRALVAEELARTGGFTEPVVQPTLGCDPPWHYRNHARFSVGPEGKLGFVRRNSHQFFPVDSCLLMHPWINQALEKLQGHGGGSHQVAVRYGVGTGQYLVQPRLPSPDAPLASGQPSYEEELCGRRFRIASSSFFQVNTSQAERLVDAVRARLPEGEHTLLVDAYAGVGTYAVLLAGDVGRVIAIEESASAIADARVNAAGLDNVEFWQGKSEHLFANLERPPDALVLNPPRIGCHGKALSALLGLLPRRIIYVSCSPHSLARDLRALCQGPYRLSDVQPVDMFPQTHHVESVATLVRHDEGVEASPLLLASASPRRRELLSLLGVPFEVAVPSGEEAPAADASPGALAEERARAKALSLATAARGRTVVAADTVVVHAGQVLGKPRSEAEARDMLRRLSGEAHEVVSGVAVLPPGASEPLIAHVTTRVHMRPYSEDEIESYVASGDAWDKAGAYAIQNPSFAPVARVEGCYLNVVGLPLCELTILLRRAGVRLPRPSPYALPPECCPCAEQKTLTET